jgi:hypothetical protein
MDLIFDNDELLFEAEQKLRKQKEIKRTLERDELARNEVDNCLKQSVELLAEVMVPDFRVCSVSVERKGNSINIGGIEIKDTPMVRSISEEASFYLYLVSLKYDSQQVLNILKGDYVIYHFQHILGREVLFAMARKLHREYSHSHPEFRFKRHAIKMKKECYEHSTNDETSGEDNYWDPIIVTNLIDNFENNNLGVQVTQSGCFSPLQTILGVMVGNKNNGDGR